jgi:hypothetical protein
MVEGGGLDGTKEDIWQTKQCEWFYGDARLPRGKQME